MSPKVLIFDAYGTLFDINAAACILADEIGPVWSDFSFLWREKQLAYTWLRSLMNSPWKSFWGITEDALDYALEFYELDPVLWRERLLNIYFELPAFEEVPTALSLLKQMYPDAAFGILSNGSTEMLDAAVEGSGLRPSLDAILSIDDVGVFKTHPKTYNLVLEKFPSICSSDVLFFSSNGWDVAGAGQFGFQTVWINRNQNILENLPQVPNVTVSTLTQFVHL